jgi:putative membrane protein
MKGFVIGMIATAIAFVFVAWLLPQVDFTGGPLQLVILALAFGVVNTFIRPLVSLLSLPVNLLTLGLFGVVVNVALLMLVAWVTDEYFKVGVTIGGWPGADLSLQVILDAFIASIVLSVTQTVVGLVVKD